MDTGPERRLLLGRVVPHQPLDGGWSFLKFRFSLSFSHLFPASELPQAQARSNETFHGTGRRGRRAVAQEEGHQNFGDVVAGSWRLF
jgi:hypothetical protein